MQVMAEALGIALPGSALIPTHVHYIKEISRYAGQRSVELEKEELLPSDILTIDAFRNAIMVHAAIAGSSNSLLHLPAIAHELGIDLPPEFIIPPGRSRAGIFSRAIAIRWAGTDLSQLVMNIPASKGVAFTCISIMAAMISRDTSE